MYRMIQLLLLVAQLSPNDDFANWVALLIICIPIFRDHRIKVREERDLAGCRKR